MINAPTLDRMTAELGALSSPVDHRGLPPRCYSMRERDNQLTVIFRDELGYFCEGRTVTDAEVDELNRQLGVSRAQRLAMEGGSMFGFDKPIASPVLHEVGS